MCDKAKRDEHMKNGTRPEGGCQFSSAGYLAVGCDSEAGKPHGFRCLGRDPLASCCLALNGLAADLHRGGVALGGVVVLREPETTAQPILEDSTVYVLGFSELLVAL